MTHFVVEMYIAPKFEEKFGFQLTCLPKGTCFLCFSFDRRFNTVLFQALSSLSQKPKLKPLNEGGNTALLQMVSMSLIVLLVVTDFYAK